jgi:hypothetical protein
LIEYGLGDDAAECVQELNLMIARSFFETTIPDDHLDAAMNNGCRTPALSLAD